MTEEKRISTFISGKTIDLISPSIDNLNLYAKWDNDPETRKYSRNIIPTSPEAFKKWLEKASSKPPREISLNIWYKNDKKIIGYVGFNHIHWVDAIADMGMVIGEKEYRGKDIGTEAIALLLEYGFNELNFFKITGRMYHVNIGSWRVAEKVGMVREITLKHQAYVKGEYVDEYQYCIFMDDWTEVRKKFDFLLTKNIGDDEKSEQ
jgi:RimJ/RimL family protein N-acetyltransferase